MAQLDENNKLFGALGNLVFRQVNGKTIVQVKPGKDGVKQTEATKKSASDFGRASRITKRLSVSLRNVFQTYYDAKMYNRFRKTVHQAMLENHQNPKGKKDLWEGDMSLLEDLEFNHSSLYTDYCSLETAYSLTQTANIKITTNPFNPKTQIKWPTKVFQAKLCYIITTYSKETYKPLKEEIFKIELSSASAPMTSQTFTSTSLASPCLAIISCCLLYYKKDLLQESILLNHKKLHPAKIAKVIRISD